jgi:hypothetical protein
MEKIERILNREDSNLEELYEKMIKNVWNEYLNVVDYLANLWNWVPNWNMHHPKCKANK